MEHRSRFSAFVAKECNFAPVIRAAMRFAREFLADHDFEAQLQVKLAIVVEELVTNALHHGGQGQHLTLSLVLREKGKSICLVLADNGCAFNPLIVPPVKEPDPQTGGGIGLAIVHTWASDASYVRNGDTNQLELTLS